MVDHRDELMDELFPCHVKQTLDQIITNEGYISYDMTFKRITKKGNLLSSLHEVNVKGISESGDKHSYLFVKLPRQINGAFFTAEDVFSREFYAYSELFKIYEELQNNANVPNEAKFKVVKSFNGPSSEAIILENLSKKYFKTLPTMEVVPLILAELSIEQLAKFHALSMVLQNQRPEYFNCKVVNHLKSFIIIDTEERDATIKKVFNYATENLSEESKKRIMMLMDTATEEVNKHQKSSKILKCLCHGDLKRNNLLYREHDYRIKEVIIIDYQMIHYGSPIDDFASFLFIDTDREFRRKYLDHLKNFYYTSLKQFLKYFDMDLIDLWSREEFENQFQEGLNFGVIHAMCAMPFAYAGENDGVYFENDVFTIDMKPDYRYKDRIQGLVDDFIEWRGILASSSDNTNQLAPTRSLYEE